MEKVAQDSSSVLMFLALVSVFLLFLWWLLGRPSKEVKDALRYIKESGGSIGEETLKHRVLGDLHLPDEWPEIKEKLTEAGVLFLGGNARLR